MPWPPASPAAVHKKMIGHLRGLKWMCLIFFLLLQLFKACCYLKATAGALFFSATCKPTCIAKIQCNSSDKFVTARNQEDSYIFRYTPHLLCKCTIPGQVMNLPARLCYFVSTPLIAMDRPFIQLFTEQHHSEEVQWVNPYAIPCARTKSHHRH